MKQYTYPSKQFDKMILQIESYTLTLKIGKHTFVAIYPQSINLEEVEKGYFDLMIYLLFYGLENIDISDTTIQIAGNNKILSYSGGADSTAILLEYAGTPVHILRYWSSEYEHRQIRAVFNVNGVNISTDFEKVRMLYGKTLGFNIGIGYACMYFPMMPAMKANTVYFGIIFDDISFHYGEVFLYTKDFSNTRTYLLIQYFKSLGINFYMPMAGYSEVLTTRIADQGNIKNFSSCNVVGDGDKCLNCYKCFRKEAIRGRKIDLQANQLLYNRVKAIMAKYPLKMASSTIYGIQHAGYLFDAFKDIDVSFLDRVNVEAQAAFFDGQILPDFEWQTDQDRENIKRFVEFINGHKGGFKI